MRTACRWLVLGLFLGAPQPGWAFQTGTDGEVNAVVLQADGKILIGGNFNYVWGVPRTNIARLNYDGTVDGEAFDGGLSSSVYALLPLANGTLVAGGVFTKAGGVTAHHVAYWNGSSWSALGDLSDSVRTLTLDGSGNIVVGGSFKTIGGVNYSNIARWDGSAWQHYGAGLGSASESVRCLQTVSGGLVAGGNFDVSDLHKIGYWDGASWHNLSAMSSTVYALTVYNGQIVAGGTFTTPTKRIGRWDGLNWYALGEGMNSTVYALAVLSNGHLLAAGAFSSPSDSIARWDGSAWQAFGSGSVSAAINTLAVQADGRVLVGGLFQTFHGYARYRLARLNADGSMDDRWPTTTALGSSPNPSVFGQTVALTATLNGGGGGTPSGGSVTFKEGATVLGTVSVSGGSATLNTSSLGVGGHAITAEYSGSSGFYASISAPRSQTVNQANTSTSIGSDRNPSTYGQMVTFTATVTVSPPGAGSPTGIVTFKDGGAALWTTNLAGGVAGYATASLGGGTHSITAQYNGDTNFNGSTSMALSQAISKADTSTGLASSKNPSTFGETVTLTATVTVTPPGGGTPTGMVAFVEGGVTLGTGNLIGGIASFGTSSLAVGDHTITANYNGSGNHNPSQSAPLVQTVNPTGGNHPPTDILLSNTSIPENQPPGTAIGTLTAIDDPGDTNTFALVDGPGSQDNDQFTINGNLLQSATNFNFEVQNTCSIRVRATDQGGLSYEEAFSIAILNVSPEIFMVIRGPGSGWGTLPEAISDANTAGEPATVLFRDRIGLINLLNELPMLTNSITIQTGTGNTVNRGLSVGGGVVVAVAGSNTFQGPSFVANGQLVLMGDSLAGSLVALKQDGILAGKGTVGGVVVGHGGRLQPGASPGQIDSGSAVWAAGGALDWEMNDAAGAPGKNPGWDWLNVAGSLDITASLTDPFILNLVSLMGTAHGPAANFDKDTPGTWTMATAGGGVNGFDPKVFIINDGQFLNDCGGGCFSMTQERGGLQVQFLPNRSPWAETASYARYPNQVLHLSIAKLLAVHTGDPDGDERLLLGVGPCSHGGIVTITPTEIIYQNPGNPDTDDFTYTIRDVRAYRPWDTIRSATGQITVNLATPPPQTITIQKLDDGVLLTCTGTPGMRHEIWRASSLTRLDWMVLAVFIMPPEGVYYCTDQITLPEAYYRTRLVISVSTGTGTVASR